MKHWQHIRARAAEVRKQIFPNPAAVDLLLDGDTVLTRLDVLTGVMREKVRPNHPSLLKSHAVINPDYYTLFYNGELPVWFAVFCQAHEYAHLFLHGGASHCSADDIKTSFNEDAVPLGENRVAGYSARERKEREANLFARELLLPSELVRKLFVEENWRAADFAKKTGLPFDFICQQMAYALLIGDAVIPEEEKGRKGEEETETPALNITSSPFRPFTPSLFQLDDSQKRAAHSDARRLLIEAGPGTGKTRTLVGRVLYLLEKGVLPANILALTYSNKAAEEMRERIALYAPEAAGQIWLGTFHAFGLDVLRKFEREAAMPAGFHLLDSVDAQILLEKHLLELNLKHYRSLHNPTENLKSILGAISRAKDELVSANEYEAAANEMLEGAEGEAEKTLAAEKAQEVACVYRFYENLLQKNGWLDFGDLIFRAVRLLQENGTVKGYYQAQYTHVLVDEYQDVNRASGVLLRELTGENGNLWVVGDARQTIYRWRGASDKNLRGFKEDFPDAENLSLAINYRSDQPIIDLLNEIAPGVITSEDFAGWRMPETAESRPQKSICYVETPDFHAEAAFLAAEIERQTKDGREYRDTAVLGRTNSILAKVADELTARNIPVLYLGNMFERDEIRDLLSLLALTSENRGRHLLRLTQISEYKLRTEEVRRLIADADHAGQRFPQAFALAESDFALSDEFKSKIAALQNQLNDITDETSAWDFLKSYLFDRSDYLLPILRDDSLPARQKRFAIYQLLQFALAEAGKNKSLRIADDNPRKSFLRLVRFLAASGEEAAFRRLPAWAENIDAVRVLTVHAAKGLEFPTVFLPYLGNAYFPNKKQKENCPLPDKYKNTAGEKDAAHRAEELCLFFVALSRAKQHLILSRSVKYGSPSNATDFFKLIPNALPLKENFDVPEAEREKLDLTAVFEPTSDDAPHRYSFYALRSYLNCPRRYYYDNILELRGDAEESLYLQYHICVQDTIRWARQEAAAANGGLTSERALAKLAEIWTEKPLNAHAYAPIYRAEAETLVTKAVEMLSLMQIDADGKQDCYLDFNINGSRVFLAPDLLLQSADNQQISARKIKTGRAKEREQDLSEDEKMLLAALHQGLRETFPNAEIQAAFSYLTGEEFTYSARNIQTQLKKIEKAVEGIRRRDFTPNTKGNCPACAHYFICPGGDL